jgi:hypothetical protein
VTAGGAMRKAEMTDNTPGDFPMSTADVRTTISIFPMFGDLGHKVEESAQISGIVSFETSMRCF